MARRVLITLGWVEAGSTNTSALMGLISYFICNIPHTDIYSATPEAEILQGKS